MEKFYLGLDIGTESVGIACADEDYNLLRAKGKDLWAVRLFDEANDAKDRRTKRTMRRRLQRRRNRINLLQAIFAQYISDKTFFIRLNNSAFLEADKDEIIVGKDNLFSDEGFNDRTFHENFPTIFHLRKALIDGKAKYDLRLYYLAIHHIVKYRGHFLFEGEDNSSRDINELFRRFNLAAKELMNEECVELPLEKAKKFVEIGLSNLGIKDKTSQTIKTFGFSSKAEKEIITLLCGGTAKPYTIFQKEDYKDLKSISLKSIKDEEFDALEEIYGEDFALLVEARAIFNFIRFEKILDGNEYISDSMISVYEKHKFDLKALKTLLKSVNSLFKKGSSPYYKMFRSKTEKFNYANYIGKTESNRNQTNLEKISNIDDFYKYTRKLLEENEEILKSEEYDRILVEVKEGTFLPKILNSDNGLFPHQINGVELDAIIRNMCRDYPEFNEVDADGYIQAEKIKKIFTFKIPYYVGPLNTAHSEKENGHSWMQRKEDGRILPWNFDKKVDLAESNEKFMRRMTNKCTYLHGADVLPKCSLYYQKYNTLNQINKLKVDDVPISIEIKQKLFNERFLVYGKVTSRDIVAFLKQIGEVPKDKKVEISGVDGEVKATMSSYVTFKRICGDLVDQRPDIFEKIILWHTLNTDKSIVVDLIKRNYSNVPEIIDNLKEIKGLSFKDFGRLSKEFLCDLEGGVDDCTGEVYTILDELYKTNMNLNELLYSERYTFLDSIKEQNGEQNSIITYEDVKNLYVSPQVRRGIWQAIKMTDEYVTAVGRVPDKIFIEVTRHDEEKKRTKSRKTQIAELYKQARDINKFLLEELNVKTDSELRSERLYLYFMQLGKCAYTGEKIDIESLGSDIYDVDHIIPQSITKDDSLDNKVLVKRAANLEKRDRYPVPQKFVQKEFWGVLRAKGLMSTSKFNRLMRREDLTSEDFNSFIAKQMVITNQTVKAVAELLERKYSQEGTRIVYSKATHVSEFKQQFDIVKCRETNDLHHARDAYLNIVVGNVYDTRFPKIKSYYYDKNGEQREYNFKNLFTRDLKNAWKVDESISTVKNVLKKPSMAVTRYSYRNMGKFYDETVYSGKEGADVPMKEKTAAANVGQYGGYKSLKTSYFCVVQSLDKKGDKIKTIEAVPVLIAYKLKTDKSALDHYLKEKVGLKEHKILVPKLNVKTLLEINGFRVYLAGMTGVQITLHNANQWFTTREEDEYVNALVKYVEFDKNGRLSDEERITSFVSKTNRFKDKKLVVNAEGNTKLYDAVIEKLSLKSYQGLSSARNMYKILSENREIFLTLTNIEQAKVILQIAKFMKCNAESSDLTLIGGKAHSGVMILSKNITKESIYFIKHSACGLYEKKIKI